MLLPVIFAEAFVVAQAIEQDHAERALVRLLWPDLLDRARQDEARHHIWDHDDGVTVPAVGGGTQRVVPRRQLCEILQPRAEELLSLVREDLAKNGWDDTLRGGVVLTGGGAKLDGLLELAQQIFAATVRYGLPQGLGGLVDVINSPTWCSASGLLLYGHAAEQNRGRSHQKRPFSVRRWVDSVRAVFSDLL